MKTKDMAMLIPPVALASTCSVLGIDGFVLANKRRRIAFLPIAAVLGVTGFTIYRLRDPLTLSPPPRHYTENWDYIFWLCASFVIGMTLTALGAYASRW